MKYEGYYISGDQEVIGRAISKPHETLHQIATRIARKRFGARAVTIEVRPGIFQGYYPVPTKFGGGLNSVGCNFKLRRAK